MDFLEHEVREVAALAVAPLFLEGLDGGGLGTTIEAPGLNPGGVEPGNLAVGHEHDLAGVGHQGVGVRRDEGLAIADADDQWRAVSGGDDHSGVVEEHHGDAPGPADTGDGLLDGRHWIPGDVGNDAVSEGTEAIVEVGDEVGEDLGVGL